MARVALIVPVGIDVSGHITLGELIVGAGTIALAIFALAQIAIERRARQRTEHREQAEHISAWPHSYWGSSTDTSPDHSVAV